ncbi:MAG: zinc-binding dehydrogenase, partial [Pseudomonadota bacterium]
ISGSTFEIKDILIRGGEGEVQLRTDSSVTAALSLLNSGNYADADLKSALKEATCGKVADVIYEPVGGDYCEPAFRAIGWKGRYLVIGFVAGIPKIPTNLALLKGAEIVGVFWGGFTQREAELNVQNTMELLQLYAQGKIKPHISEHFPLDKAPEAIAHLSARKAKGKVVVMMD